MEFINNLAENPQNTNTATTPDPNTVINSAIKSGAVTGGNELVAKIDPGKTLANDNLSLGSSDIVSKVIENEKQIFNNTVNNSNLYKSTTILTGPGVNGTIFMTEDERVMAEYAAKKKAALAAQNVLNTVVNNQNTNIQNTQNTSTNQLLTGVATGNTTVEPLTASQTTINQAPTETRIETNQTNINSTQTAPSSEKIMEYLVSSNTVEPIQNAGTVTNNETNLSNNQTTVNNQPGSRVESKELVSKNEITKITKPVNPVVVSVEQMNREVTTKLEGVGQNIKNSMTNMAGNSTVNNSSNTSIDQSSNVTTMGSEGQNKPIENKETNPEALISGGELSEFYLSSIYELLSTGIKVKISY